MSLPPVVDSPSPPSGPAHRISPEPKLPLGCGTKIILGICASCTLLVVMGIAGLMVIGMIMPPEYATRGEQMRTRERQAVKELGLLQPGERIRYFYSSSLSARNACVFHTGRRLVLHDSEWERPITIELAQVRRLSATFSETWIDDSQISVHTQSDGTFFFSVGMAKGADQALYADLEKAVIKAGGSTGATLRGSGAPALGDGY